MKSQKILILIGICLVVTAFNKIYAQQLPIDPQVTIGKLPNGFTYYVRKNSIQKKRVVMYLVNKVGSILETEEQRGLAHFMEHVSFNGSTHFPGSTLVDFLEKAGVRFGADLNAYTSFDETVYQLPIALDKPEMLGSGLQVIRDWADEASLDQKEIDKERGIVLEEKRLRSGASQRIQQQIFPLMVNQSRYAEREAIGTEEVLNNFHRETLLSFYKDWYRPDLQAIVVVGDINEEDVVARIRKLFGDLKAPDMEKPRPEYKIDLTGKNQFLAITDKEVQGTQLQIKIKYPHKKLLTNLDYLDHVERNLFNQLMAIRFQSVSQKNAGNYLSVNAGLGPLVANVDAFSASVSARPGELEKGFAAFWKEISKIKSDGFTAAELEMAKTRYLTAMTAAANEGDKIQSAQYAKEYTRHFLLGEAIPGIEKEAELTEAYLATISLAHLNLMARQYITNTNRDVYIIAPDAAAASLPNAQQMEDWFTKYENTERVAVSPDDERAALALVKMPLIPTPPAKGKVVSSSKNKELNITELKLSNGVRVILKPTAFKNDQISFSAFSPGGTSVYPDSDYLSASNAVSIVVGGGLGSFSRENLQQKLTGKQVSVTPYIAERMEGISGGSDTKDLETALQLTYLYFTSPRKDTAVFNADMSRLKAVLASQINTPEKVFSDTLTAVMTNNSFRRRSLGFAQLGQINLDKAFRVYQDRFKDASDFTFVFVGNFDPNKIQPLLEQYLGSLPSTYRKEMPRDLGIEIPKGTLNKTVYKGSGDKATVRLLVSGNYVFSGESALQLRALKYILSLKMIERLREHESGVYSPAVSATMSKSPKSRYLFSIQFSCAPENVDKLINAAWDEITKLKNNGPAADDLEKFVAEEKIANKNQLESNGFWLSYLTNQYQEQLDPNEILSMNSKLDALTAAQLKNSMNAYWDGKNYIRAVLMPENRRQ